ncbi:MAG: PAS domain S-box protein [Desulfobacteraceae bacterium]|nr:PAS domain S-box protein [Desulfobacteraceae bacterium]
MMYFYSVPLIKKSIYNTQEDAAITILQSVYDLVVAEYISIETYREYALDAYKRQLKNICLFQESFLKNKYQLFEQGLISEEDAKNQALEELRSFRYGNDDYVWVSDYNSVLISHPDPRLHLTDYSLVSDKNGKLIVPSVVKTATEKNEGYTSYWWRRLGDEEFIEKLTFSKNFPEWEWVIATGVYIDDVEKEVARRKKKMIQEIRLLLHKIKIARTGYMYIFDSDINMIIHPNLNIENTNFSELLNPLTNKPIGEELIAAAHSNDSKVFYEWDKPDDKGRYIYEKISWVKYIEEFDWYIAFSVYVEELKSTAITIRNRILMVAAIFFLVSLRIASLFLNKTLVPIRTLSKVAARVRDGNFSVRCDITGKDEFGVLASAFNSMVTRIENNISSLDMEVHKRTRELVMANEQMMREIEDRKVAEEALRESEEKYRTILESIEDGYYEVDLAGNIIFFNDSLCRHLGYTRDELVNMIFRNIADGVYAEKITYTFSKTFRTGEPVKAFDWKFVRKDGSKYYVETSVSLMKNSGAPRQDSGGWPAILPSARKQNMNLNIWLIMTP